MKHKKKTLLKNFLVCGMVGWCLEITFTALGSLRKREYSLKGTTSIWMFPIYGMACLLGPIHKRIRNWHVAFRGTLYATLIFTMEYLSGNFLKKHNLCPWDYKKSKWNVNGSIRFDFFPFWFLTGLLYEKILDNLTHKKG